MTDSDMSDDRGRPVDGDLRPDAAAVIDQYFERYRLATIAAGSSPDDDTVADLRAHVTDRVGSAGGPGDAARVLSELGAPEALAAEVAAVGPEIEPDAGTGAHGDTASSGRILGVPYDLRRPSSERYASRWWNPLDGQVLVPKVWGVGWTINFGALAVLARTVRPDDEDVPFGAVPPRTVAATFAAPVVALAVFAVFAALSWGSLPVTVPTHWAISGRVDGYGGRASNLLFLSLLAAVPVALAGWVHARRRPPVNRVAASAGSLAMVALAIAALAQTLFTADGGTGVWPVWTGLGCFVALPFALLVCVSRIGRAEEQRRDMPDGSTKGRVS